MPAGPADLNKNSGIRVLYFLGHSKLQGAWTKDRRSSAELTRRTGDSCKIPLDCIHSQGQ